LERAGQPARLARRKALALAAYLALAEQPVSREAAAALLWPELPAEQARAALRSTLPALTALSPDHWLGADRATLAVSPAAVWVDVNAFRGLAAESRRHGHAPEALCPECLPLLAQALTLYQGEFMAGFSL